MKKIAIFSVPRSGSSWLGEIFNSSPNVYYRFQPNFAYTFPLNLNKKSTFEDIENFNMELIKCRDPFVNGRLSISGKNKEAFSKFNLHTLVWKETHYIFLSEILLERSSSKVIGLIRSPFATIFSWLNIPKEFSPKWDIREQWRLAPLKNKGQTYNYFGYEKWKEVAFLFERLQQQYPDRFYLQDYNTLLTQTTESVQKLFDFAGLELTEQTKSFLKDSRSKEDQDAYGVYKTKNSDDQWKTGLPDYIIEEIQNDPEFRQLNEKYSWI